MILLKVMTIHPQKLTIFPFLIDEKSSFLYTGNK